MGSNSSRYENKADNAKKKAVLKPKVTGAVPTTTFNFGGGEEAQHQGSDAQTQRVAQDYADVPTPRKATVTDKTATPLATSVKATKQDPPKTLRVAQPKPATPPQTPKTKPVARKVVQQSKLKPAPQASFKSQSVQSKAAPQTPPQQVQDQVSARAVKQSVSEASPSPAPISSTQTPRPQPVEVRQVTPQPALQNQQVNQPSVSQQSQPSPAVAPTQVFTGPRSAKPQQEKKPSALGALFGLILKPSVGVSLGVFVLGAAGILLGAFFATGLGEGSFFDNLSSGTAQANNSVPEVRFDGSGGVTGQQFEAEEPDRYEEFSSVPLKANASSELFKNPDCDLSFLYPRTLGGALLSASRYQVSGALGGLRLSSGGPAEYDFRVLCFEEGDLSDTVLNQFGEVELAVLEPEFFCLETVLTSNACAAATQHELYNGVADEDLQLFRMIFNGREYLLVTNAEDASTPTSIELQFSSLETLADPTLGSPELLEANSSEPTRLYTVPEYGLEIEMERSYVTTTPRYIDGVATFSIARVISDQSSYYRFNYECSDAVLAEKRVELSVGQGFTGQLALSTLPYVAATSQAQVSGVEVYEYVVPDRQQDQYTHTYLFQKGAQTCTLEVKPQLGVDRFEAEEFAGERVSMRFE